MTPEFYLPSAHLVSHIKERLQSTRERAADNSHTNSGTNISPVHLSHSQLCGLTGESRGEGHRREGTVRSGYLQPEDTNNTISTTSFILTAERGTKVVTLQHVRIHGNDLQ